MSDSDVVFPMFCPLDAGIRYFGPENRILREISSRNRLERSRIWNPGAKMRKFIALHVFLIRSLGYKATFRRYNAVYSKGVVLHI